MSIESKIIFQIRKMFSLRNNTSVWARRYGELVNANDTGHLL